MLIVFRLPQYFHLLMCQKREYLLTKRIRTLYPTLPYPSIPSVLHNMVMTHTMRCFQEASQLGPNSNGTRSSWFIPLYPTIINIIRKMKMS